MSAASCVAWMHITYLTTCILAEFFGEQSLMQARDGTNQQGLANATVQCVSFCDLLTLGKDDFDDVVREHMSDEMIRTVATVSQDEVIGACAHKPSQSPKTRMKRASTANVLAFYDEEAAQMRRCLRPSTCSETLNTMRHSVSDTDGAGPDSGDADGADPDSYDDAGLDA